MNNKLDENLKEVLKEMCRRVCVDYKKIDFTKNGWFLEHTWTKEEEDAFKKWLVNYITKNKKARNALMRFPTTNKKEITNFAEEFLFYCGWKNMDK